MEKLDPFRGISDQQVEIENDSSAYYGECPGTLWAWIVWIVAGGLAGALADRLIQGDKLGILDNIVVGIVGGVILGLFGIEADGILWTFLTAFAGAALLLWLINILTGGRGIGKRASV
jgi:uncharacterized membrane protein YeaQ/YmgE (transglycosylase-associated protein family)